MGVHRGIHIYVHSALETLIGPAMMVAPFVFGFGEAAGVLSITLGALLLGLALSVHGTRRMIPLSAHAGFDYLLALAAIVAGIAVGIATGDAVATVFLVGVGAAQTALAAITRYSLPRGA